MNETDDMKVSSELTLGIQIAYDIYNQHFSIGANNPNKGPNLHNRK